jgi:hypothetical protein
MADAWDLKGTYFESCNCEAACPCIFLSPPSDGECKAVVAWHVESGKSGDVSLDGLNVALAVHSPGHMMETKWKAALYLDAKGDEAQQGALTQIFAGQAGGHPAILASFVGEVLGVKAVPIEYEANGKARRLTITDVAEIEMEGLEGQGGAPVTVTNHPLCIAPGEPAVVGKAKKLSFNDYGLTWEFSDKNGFFSPFAYQGP